MRFDFAALGRFLVANASSSVTTLAAAGGATLAILTVLYLIWPASDDMTTEQVVVSSGSVYTPVTLTPPPPSPAANPHQPGSQPGMSQAARVDPAPRYDDAVSVTRGVQRHLKQAGCYDGPVNGAWNGQTRKAMYEFTGVVNARLPVDRPDPVLLVLLESNPDASCASGCADADDCESPVQRDARRDERANAVAGIERERPPTMRQEAREDTLPAPVSAETHSGADDLGFDPEDQRAPNPIASVQTASTEDDGVGMEDAAALGAAGAAAHEVTKPKPRRVAARKYRKKNSFSRELNRSFRKLSRSLNKLF